MEIKSIIKQFSVADFEEEQGFLSLQHSLGWKLMSIKHGLYTFEKSPAEKFVYQLDYNPTNQDEDEYIQLFIDYGWEFIQKNKSRFYFRKLESDLESDNNIFSDRESKAEMCRKIVNRRLFLLIPLTFIVIILNVLLQTTGLIPVSPFSIFTTKVIAGTTGFVLTIVFYVSYFDVIFKLNRIVRSDKNQAFNELANKKKTIPNTVLVLLSIIVSITAMIFNLGEFAYGHAKPINTVITLCYILFWMIFLILARKEGKLLMYSTIFWGLTFITAIVMILINLTSLELVSIALLAIPLIGPLIGIDIIFADNVVTLSIIAFIAVVFTACGIWFIIKRKGDINMKVVKILAVVFGILTICGAIYVFVTGGQTNAGYAVIPMVLCLAFAAWARKKTKNENEEHS